MTSFSLQAGAISPEARFEGSLELFHLAARGFLMYSQMLQRVEGLGVEVAVPRRLHLVALCLF